MRHRSLVGGTGPLINKVGSVEKKQRRCTELKE